MKIRIRVPDKVGAYKLNRVARQRVALDLISRNLKLFNKMSEDVSEISLIVDNKHFKINQQEVIRIISKMKRERRRQL